MNEVVAFIWGVTSAVAMCLLVGRGRTSPHDRRLRWVFIVGAIQLGSILGWVQLRDTIFRVRASERDSFLLAYAGGLAAAAIPFFIKWSRAKE